MSVAIGLARWERNGFITKSTRVGLLPSHLVVDVDTTRIKRLLRSIRVDGNATRVVFPGPGILAESVSSREEASGANPNRGRGGTACQQSVASSDVAFLRGYVG